MTQEKLAEYADITVNHLYRIEHGKSAASIDVVERLAYALCVEIKDLFEFSDLPS
jgi:transcriptional regulator with XRE-family HTH domain